VSECPGKGRICGYQKGRDARGGGQRFFGYLPAKSAGYGGNECPLSTRYGFYLRILAQRR
jgi:hypothetical protein